MPARILITDDHKLLREGLRCLLENRGFEVTGEAEDGRSAIRLAKQLEPDAVIIDISLPGLNGIEATRQIHQNSPQVKIVVLSMRADSRAVLAALAAGASAYLLKEAAFEEVVIALRVALNGQTYLSPAIAHVVVQSSVQYWSANPGSVRDGISGREREILQLVAEGRSSKEMAASLFVSVKTIETHRKQIMNKLHLHSIAELTKYAIREGVTSL
ncbi:MAG TPA: response regulator transcription factor [Candidatus Binatia bacterium]|nr:response regulator transcription factor [Candidatus Binatia bacterium]